MGLRLVGALAAALLAGLAVVRFKRGQLKRGELGLVFIVVTGLTVAALAPQLFDPILQPLGLRPGSQRRLIGVLVFSNLFTLALVFVALTRSDRLSNEIGDHVDYVALRRLEDEGWRPTPGVCAVVIPAFNEEENLPAVLAELPTEIEGMPVEPIVVADGCTDATEAVARNYGATVIRRELRRGQGAAMRLGYIVALLSQARIIVTLDADGQHDPKEMDRLVKPLVVGDAEMVHGSRTLGSFDSDSKARTHGIRVFARIVSFLGRTRITDPSNGYRAVKPEALRLLDLRQDQFHVSELIMDAVHKGLKVVEVPVTVRKRASGTTKKGTSVRYAWGFGRTLVRTWLRQPPAHWSMTFEPRWLSSSGVNSTPDHKGDGKKRADVTEQEPQRQT